MTRRWDSDGGGDAGARESRGAGCCYYSGGVMPRGAPFVVCYNLLLLQLRQPWRNFDPHRCPP